MFTPRRLMSSGGETFLAWLDALAATVGTVNVAYWPVDDSFSATANTLDQRFETSSGSYNKGGGTYFEAQAGVLFSDMGGASGRVYCDGVGTNGNIVGEHNSGFADGVDWTVACAVKHTVNGAVETFHVGTISDAGGVRHRIGVTGSGVNLSLGWIDDTGGARFAINSSGTYDITQPHLMALTQSYNGSTYDYRAYVDGAAAGTDLANATPALTTTVDRWFFQGLNASDSSYSSWIQGVLIIGTAAGGGGALSATQHAKIASLIGV